MSLVCAQCSRSNPAEAAFCYYDGAALAGRVGGPVNAGSAPFPSQFVFPSGQACLNFDQLGTACQQNWAAAVDLLKKGFLGSFFGSMGRADLAMAAQEAANFPDADRGLDQLLAKLPTQALQAPKLKAEPSEISLGVMKIGSDRTTELHLSNLGMRLLYGTVATDCKWLVFGEAPGHQQKLFQFGSDSVIPVHVVGKFLRAGNKPLQGNVSVESNGGSATITVRADVPVTPYKDGLFAGAQTPRQVAEKSKANPKEAAPYFENGQIREWYSSNGWAYPVQGPTMSGMGAVQQFFEALGVAKPPKVELTSQSLTLDGEPSRNLVGKIEVSTQERKPVYAWANCDQDWVEFGKTQLNGRTAFVPVTIHIPAGAPPQMDAKIQVTGNGNQRFTLPLRVNVKGGIPGATIKPRNAPETIDTLDVVSEPTNGEGNPFAAMDTAISASPATVNVSASALPDPVGESDGVVSVSRPGRTVTRGGSSGIGIVQLIPMALLILVVLGVFVRDLFSPAAGQNGNVLDVSPDNVDPRPRVGIAFDYPDVSDGVWIKDSVTKKNMRVGLVVLDPNNPGANDPPKLTFGQRGHTNNTVVKIDQQDLEFGHSIGGQWFTLPHKSGKYGGMACMWKFPPDIYVTQDVHLVPGDLSQSSTDNKRLLDTCLIKYRLENKGTKSHRVGLRYILDTYIGNNDGVPFTLPGQDELVSSFKDFTPRDKVPDFIQVLEKPDLKDPGVVAQLNFRISDKLQPPDRVSLTHWPESDIVNKREVPWEIKMAPMDKDSAVVMYWNLEELKPGKHRDIGFTYGLGSVTAGGAAQVGVTVGGSFYVGGDLTVVALVTDRKTNTLKLEVPQGLELIAGAKALQNVPPAEGPAEGPPRPRPVTWRLRATNSGTFTLNVSSDSGAQQSRRIRIEAKSLF